MANPLAQSQRSALRMNDDIGDLFAAVGTSEHPRGYVLSAYRQARRAMKTALGEVDRMNAVRDVFAGLRSTVRAETVSLFMDSQWLGSEEAARQLRFYKIDTRPGNLLTEREASAAMLDAVLSRIDAQELAARALLFAGAEDEQITGDENQAGVLRPSDLLTTLTASAAALVWSAFSRWVELHSQPTIRWEKQVIAALDARTTDCCLRAHGQVQPLDKPFELTGVPRFADKKDWTPFHHYCRSSVALYQASYDTGLTAQMREGADWFLAERRAGRSPDRHPADAFA